MCIRVVPVDVVSCIVGRDGFPFLQKLLYIYIL